MAEEKADKASKKKLKALAFRKSKEERASDKAQKEARRATAEPQVKRLPETGASSETSHKRASGDSGDSGGSDDGAEGEQAKKKRKTRRGKKGKAANGGTGPRFILFVGNLPYDTQQAEVETHFQTCRPDRIRVRREKGIAFLEFDNDTKEVQSKMNLALRMHHSTFRSRKINVELTVGGGGNSQNRQSKLKEKNEKLQSERKERLKKEESKKQEKERALRAESGAGAVNGGMHPARAALMEN